MRTSLILALLAAAAASTRAQPPAVQATGAVRVRLAEPPEGGVVRLLLYDAPATFGRLRDPVRAAGFAPGASEYVLPEVPAGVYALVVHHDEDADGEIARNFIGIPTEPIAISLGYRPKGPPAFPRASFALGEGETRVFDLELYRVLGPRGLIGVGAGVVARSSPYVGSDGGVFQPIPAITFNGKRVQWFGPNLRVGLAGSDRLRLAATATYRLRAYEEDDSPALAGLGDRSDTLMLGLALVAELPSSFDVTLGYEHDVLDEIGGGTARLAVRRPIPWGVARLTPEAALRWSAADLGDHDFGVPLSAATAERPAYDVGDHVSFEAGVGALVELGESWILVLDVGVDFLPGEVTGSPIVDDEAVVRGFLALSYSL